MFMTGVLCTVCGAQVYFYLLKVKTLTIDCSGLRNDALKVREELRSEKTRREMLESDVGQLSAENGKIWFEFELMSAFWQRGCLSLSQCSS